MCRIRLFFLRYCFQLIYFFEIVDKCFTLKLRFILSEIIKDCVLREFSCQQSGRKRKVRNKGDALFFTVWKKLFLGITLYERIFGLEDLQIAVSIKILQLLIIEVRSADCFDFPLILQLFQSARHFSERCFSIRKVNIIQINVICFQPL